MLIIKRTMNTRNDRFTVYAKEQGFGRGPKVEGVTLKQAQLALAHYFGSGAGRCEPDCPFCARVRTK